MPERKMDVREKAVEMNLDPASYGTFAEIGAGQEVVRWFFRVGGAAGTVAKTISAYDMTVSTAVYGKSDRYVSRSRLHSMLDHEYSLLVGRLEEKRGRVSQFFSFANTVATRSFSRNQDGEGWVGIRFQHRCEIPTSQIIIHVRLFDRESSREQEALGTLGVNLIYGAFHCSGFPSILIRSLMDGLSRERVEIDMISVSGPAFEGVDDRLLSLQLVEFGFTDATVLNADGEVVQVAEVVYNRLLLVERGSFRPVLKPALEMLERVEAQLLDGARSRGAGEPLVLMEMTLRNVHSEEQLEHSDFLALADMLGALGKTAMVSNFRRYDELTTYFRRYTREEIVYVLGVPGMLEIFDENEPADLDGGTLAAMGRLFRKGVSLQVYPYQDMRSGSLIDAPAIQVAPHLRSLYKHLIDNDLVKPILGSSEARIEFLPREVRAKIQSGDLAWEEMVPPTLVPLIKSSCCTGLCENRSHRQELRG